MKCSILSCNEMECPVLKRTENSCHNPFRLLKTAAPFAMTKLRTNGNRPDKKFKTKITTWAWVHELWISVDKHLGAES